MLDRPPVLTLTDSAANQIKSLLESADEPALGLRISVVPRGCSGMAYQIEYATEEIDTDELVEDKGVKIFIDPAAVMFMIGSEMDYIEGKMESGFAIKNPNEKGRCGCGESFHA